MHMEAKTFGATTVTKRIKFNVQITDPTGTIEGAIFLEMAAEFYDITGADATYGLEIVVRSAFYGSRNLLDQHRKMNSKIKQSVSSAWLNYMLYRVGISNAITACLDAEFGSEFATRPDYISAPSSNPVFGFQKTYPDLGPNLATSDY
ncbi:hypothetical protein RHMOL_Rhmol04G0239700 [Rhododendron molle]|uniref:Uncharacterized protein n=1 Tax=Rhododendron molle TaxID=49168 RepID=A0ACC0P673_RHOML|nr:hypothetical protein RHMOL_Rhmol04G0239700 [Rhododendron molle]